MNSTIRTMSFSFLALLLSGCLEQSVVIKIQQDKSATIHVRKYQENFSAKKSGKEGSSKMPTQPQADAAAASIGDGVSVLGIRPSTNDRGYAGFEVVFHCEDVNKIELNADYLFRLGDGQSKDEKKPSITQRFVHDGQQVKIVQTIPAKAATREQTPQETAIFGQTSNPFGKSIPGHPNIKPSKNPLGSLAGSEMIAKVISQVNAGLFVEFQDAVTSHNAKHLHGKILALTNLEGQSLDEKMIPKFVAIGDPDTGEKIEQLQRLADSNPGLDMDLQPEITIDFIP